MSEPLVVLSTVGTPDDAQRIARQLVERGLAACVNVVTGIGSVYRWKGQVESETEHLLVIKTTAEAFEPMRAALVSLHPYEVPEVLALPVRAGHGPYLAWLDDNVGARARSDEP